MEKKRRDFEIISIRALRGEGDLPIVKRKEQRKHFNPRPPWGGRRGRYRH